MPSVADVRDRLPSLYRPSPGDRGLLTQFLRAVVAALEEVNVDAGDVMNAHWLPYADRALFSRFFLAERRERGLPPPNQANPEDAKELARYPHIQDLARLAAVLPLPPWQAARAVEGQPAQRKPQAPAAHQGSSPYPERLGVMTRCGHRRGTAAGRPRSGRRATRPRLLDQGVRAARGQHARRTCGVPDDLVGPLMRFTTPTRRRRRLADDPRRGLEPVEDSSTRPRRR